LSLIEAGAALDVHDGSMSNKFGLAIAASNGRNEIVKSMITAGASIDVTSRSSNDTALIMALESNNTESVKLLIAAGASLFGSSLVCAAAINNLEIVKMLIAAGA
jgi:ankyrin repeat protein